ncbi:MAG TPA: hypothetical protein VGP46_06180 [Acidimicrobiales bacterium]|jgi:hypothetical protein|nr:hypothetical protein [Acidimicrobiales bacterium]
MNKQTRMFQWIGGLGIVFAVLFVAAQALVGNEPSTTASGAAVLKYYQAHRQTETAAVFVIAAACIAFTFFLGSLRRKLGSSPDGRQLSSVLAVGGAVYAGGLLLLGVFTVAAVDAAHQGMTSAAQTLNVLASDDWLPVVVGLSIVSLSTGIAAVRGRTLPRWLAWASIALGILALAGPLGAIAFLLAPLWTLATGIVLMRSPAAEPASQASQTAGVPSPSLSQVTG